MEPIDVRIEAVVRIVFDASDRSLSATGNTVEEHIQRTVKQLAANHTKATVLLELLGDAPTKIIRY